MTQSRRFMLDTNVVSIITRYAPVSIEKRMHGISANLLCVSIITKAELLYGLAWTPDAKKLVETVRQFLARTDALPWNDAAAETYAKLRASLRRGAVTLGDLDLLIAAHALS